jgi:hypothetical protein
MFRRAFLALLLATCAGWIASGPGLKARQTDEEELQPSSLQVRKEVIAVIEGQLKAFRAHQLDRAYSFAAPALRLQVSQEQFMALVKTGYPEIWTNQSASYGVVRSSDERATVAVKVKSGDGTASYDYILLKVADNWLVGGVLRHVVQPDTSL